MVQPALTYGCVSAPLSSADIAELNATQTATIKTALGLPHSAHHSALLAAAGITPAHEMIRAACFRAARGALRTEHRLQQAFVSGLAKLAMCPSSLGGSLLPQLFMMSGSNLSAVYLKQLPDGRAAIECRHREPTTGW